MEYKAVQKYVRSTPKKLRIAAAMTGGLTPKEAVEMLPYSGKRAAEPLAKVIRSAMANAISQGVSEESLSIKEIQINEGPRLKRGRPVSKGMWHPVLKRWSHILVILTDEKTEKKVKKEETKVEAKEEVKLKKTTPQRIKKAGGQKGTKK